MKSLKTVFVDFELCALKIANTKVSVNKFILLLQICKLQNTQTSIDAMELKKTLPFLFSALGIASLQRAYMQNCNNLNDFVTLTFLLLDQFYQSKEGVFLCEFCTFFESAPYSQGHILPTFSYTVLVSVRGRCRRNGIGRRYPPLKGRIRRLPHQNVKENPCSFLMLFLFALFSIYLHEC